MGKKLTIFLILISFFPQIAFLQENSEEFIMNTFWKAVLKFLDAIPEILRYLVGEIQRIVYKYYLKWVKDLWNRFSGYWFLVKEEVSKREAIFKGEIERDFEKIIEKIKIRKF